MGEKRLVVLYIFIWLAQSCLVYCGAAEWLGSYENELVRWLLFSQFYISINEINKDRLYSFSHLLAMTSKPCMVFGLRWIWIFPENGKFD